MLDCARLKRRARPFRDQPGVTLSDATERRGLRNRRPSFREEIELSTRDHRTHRTFYGLRDADAPTANASCPRRSGRHGEAILRPHTRAHRGREERQTRAAERGRNRQSLTRMREASVETLSTHRLIPGSVFAGHAAAISPRKTGREERS